MKVRNAYALPREQDEQARRAARLEWISLAIQCSTVALMALVMGSSQAMRTAWMEDTLSLVPPIAYLIAARVRNKPPDESYPYGRHRVVSIGFLVAATALFTFGVVLVVNSVATLVRAEHPSIGYVWIRGHRLWLGWAMIAALVYSIVPTLVLGRLKLPLARALHAKVLHADATMNKADWQTGAAAIAGVLGIGCGWWWADAAAAAAIAGSVLHDGWSALRTVTADLMDHTPRPVDEREDFDMADKVHRYFASLDWVLHADLRLREEGDVCVGEVFVRAREGSGPLVERIAEATRDVQALDWRLYDLVVTLVPNEAHEPPG